MPTRPLVIQLYVAGGFTLCVCDIEGMFTCFVLFLTSYIKTSYCMTTKRLIAPIILSFRFLLSYFCYHAHCFDQHLIHIQKPLRFIFSTNSEFRNQCFGT